MKRRGATTYLGFKVVPHLKEGTCWRVCNDLSTHVDLVLVHSVDLCNYPQVILVDSCICLHRNELVDLQVTEDQTWTPITVNQYQCVRQLVTENE